MIIDGRLIADLVNTKSQISLNACTFSRRAKLLLIMIGTKKDSIGYIKQKQKQCLEFGIDSDVIYFEEITPIKQVLESIDFANADAAIDGIIIQMPLPEIFIKQAFEIYPHQDIPRIVIDRVTPDKDIDGLTTLNIGRYVAAHYHPTTFVPATATGVMKILEYIDYPLENKNVVIIGRSLIVGKPLAMLLLQQNAAVTLLHSYVTDLSFYTKHADVLISAVGKPNLITKNFVKQGAVVIDVGMTKNSDNKFVGDVLFDEVKDWASFITPVPGGVGPLTVAFIISNLVKAYIHHNESKTEFSV